MSGINGYLWHHNANMLVKSGARDVVTSRHISHLNLRAAQERFDFAQLLFVQLRLAATGATSGTRCGQTGLRPLTDQTALKFGQRCEHMEVQLTRRPVGFNLFHQTFKPDATLLKVGYDLHQIGQAAPEPIQPPYH